MSRFIRRTRQTCHASGTKMSPALSLLSRAIGLSLLLPAAWATAAAPQDATPEMERMVITATQTQHSELSAPASVSVINRSELEALVIDAA